MSNIENCFLLNDEFSHIVDSPTFLDKKVDGILSFYHKDNDFQLHKDNDLNKNLELISNAINSSPDGYIVFVTNEYKDDIREIILNELMKAFENNDLNFDNGGYSETVLYHEVDNGLVIELVDPECFSEFFVKLVENFKNFKEENNINHADLICVELNHMRHNLYNLKETIDGQEILRVLNRNAIEYLT